MILEPFCSLFLSYPHQQGCREPAGRHLPAGHSQDTAALWPPAWGLHHSPPAASAEQLRERERDTRGGWVSGHTETDCQQEPKRMWEQYNGENSTVMGIHFTLNACSECSTWISHRKLCFNKTRAEYASNLNHLIL